MIVCLRTVLVPPEWRESYLAWIATPHRAALTASGVHQAVSYRPITRYEVTGRYLTLPGLTVHDPNRAIEEQPQ